MGLGAGQIVVAEDLRPRGIVYQGNRNSNKATAGGTVEVGVIRLDSMVLKAGYSYKVTTSNLRVGSTINADHYKCTLRYQGAGVSANTGSAEFARCEMTCPGASISDSMGPLLGYLNVVADDIGSVILTMVRTGGTGTITMQSDLAGIWLTVENAGLSAPDNGIDL